MADEFKEERLDSPLVVHKKDDASYQETANKADMSATHSDDENSVPTLERHRFRKEKKGNKGAWVIIVLIAIAVGVVCALFYSGVISLGEKETTAKPQKTYVSTTENKYEGIITVKGTYIFFEGKEVDGLQGLEKEIKYLDAGAGFIIQDENADSNFLNLDILSLLTQYNIDYDVKHIVSSGLVSKYENLTSENQKQSETVSADASDSVTE